MYQTYHLMKNFELQKKKYFGNNVLRKPIRLGCFAVTSHGAERHSLNDNPESCYYKYSLDKEKLSNEHLDLKVACEEKLEKEEDVLKLNGELDVFLGQILKNKDKYLLNQAGSSQASGPPTNQGSESLDNLMGGMRLNSGDAESDAKLLATDFVALRATLAILLNCQYDNAKTFVILAELFRGSIYLEMKREHNGIGEITKHANARKKFEIYSSKPFDEKPAGENTGGDERPASEDKDEFRRRATSHLCFIFKNQINQHRLLYSASMGCFQNEFSLEGELNSDAMGAVECKIIKELSNEKEMKKFRRFKTVRFWSQAVLSNTELVALGFWRNDMIAFKAEEYTVEGLTKIGEWNEQACLLQLNNILTFIKKSFKDHQPAKLLKFEHESFSKKIVCLASDQPVLPDFYKTELSA